MRRPVQIQKEVGNPRWNETTRKTKIRVSDVTDKLVHIRKWSYYTVRDLEEEYLF